MNKKLTQKQRMLLKELKQLSEIVGLDYDNIFDYDREARSYILMAMKDKMVRGYIISQYTLVDEFLSCEICRYYFGRKRSFPSLWRTKHFQIFNHYIIQELYLLQKLRLVNEIRKIPKPISKNIEELNNLRNAIAHAFFPENLRKFKTNKPSWRGLDIFTINGVRAFEEDMNKLNDYFLRCGST